MPVLGQVKSETLELFGQVHRDLAVWFEAVAGLNSKGVAPDWEDRAGRYSTAEKGLRLTASKLATVLFEDQGLLSRCAARPKSFIEIFNGDAKVPIADLLEFIGYLTHAVTRI